MSQVAARGTSLIAVVLATISGASGDLSADIPIPIMAAIDAPDTSGQASLADISSDREASARDGLADDALPDRRKLEKLIRTFHRAYFASDYATQYEMQLPYLREGLSFEDWKRGFQIEDEEKTGKTGHLMRVRLTDIVTCASVRHPATPSEIVRCILTVDVSYKDSDGKKETTFKETWEYFEGQWYFGTLLPY